MAILVPVQLIAVGVLATSRLGSTQHRLEPLCNANLRQVQGAGQILLAYRGVHLRLRELALAQGTDDTATTKLLGKRWADGAAGSDHSLIPKSSDLVQKIAATVGSSRPVCTKSTSR